jgi:AAA domain
LLAEVGENVVSMTIARGLADFSDPAIPDEPVPQCENVGISTPSRMLVTCNLSDIAPEKIEWLWPGRMAIGKLTLMAGEPGLGKSQVALGVAAAVTTSGRWPNSENDYAPSGSVIILSAEDGLGRYHKAAL